MKRTQTWTVRGTLAAMAVGSACSTASPTASERSQSASTAVTNVEVKVMLDPAQAAQIDRLLDLGEAEQRAVTFYDTPSLSLYGAGIVLRTRQVDGDDDDSTVKLRPFLASDVDPTFAQDEGFKCELDRSGAHAVESCSITAVQDRGEIGRAATGQQPFDKLFSDVQERFLQQHAHVPEWTALRALGPIPASVWKSTVAGVGKVTVERWTIPGGPISLEASVRVPLAEGDAADQQLRGWLASRHVALDTPSASLAPPGSSARAQPASKTRVAMEFFASTLAP